MMMATINQQVDEPAMIRGEMRHNEPMSKHTSWRVGGPADQFYVPADRDDLISFLHDLSPTTPVTWAGLGSNLLVRDGGIRGVIIATHRGLGDIHLLDDDGTYAEAGVPGAKIARYSVRAGLTGAEFFAGIPGTLGGALAMNAGAFGAETWKVVTSVETVDRTGCVHRRSPAEFEIGYRSVVAPRPDEWFIAAELGLIPGDVEGGRRRIKSLLTQRAQTQPVQIPSAGSVFRNPPGDYAARLIESCDLKGVCEGRACVSQRHANFIENRGGATAEQIELLVRRVQREVEMKHGILLEVEIRIIGEHK
jgi:UDP-N-acetylmuramate dehydrogenase